MSVAAILANWKYAAMGVLALACAILFGLWKWEAAAYANFKTEQAKAVLKAQARADALSTDLLIEQAKSYAVTEKTVVEYRDRIRAAPGDKAKNTLGTQAVKDILGGGK